METQTSQGVTKLVGSEMFVPDSVKSLKVLTSLDKTTKDIRNQLGYQPNELFEDSHGKTWPKWLVNSDDERALLDTGDGQNKFRTVIELIARSPQGMLTHERLLGAHTKIERLIETGDVGLDLGSIWLQKIEERLEQLDVEPMPVTLQNETTPPARVQELYIGAVFDGGKNQPYLVDPRMVDLLDPSNPDDRRVFTYRNLYAFNFLYLRTTKMGPSWLFAAKDQEADLVVAREKGAQISEKEIDKFKEFTRAAMAVTASARAMEVSEGALTTYGKILTGGDRGPDTGWQDTNEEFLLHARPDMIATLLEDPLVDVAYSLILDDLGIDQTPDLEWHGDRYQTPGIVTLAKNASEILHDSLIIDYMKSNSKKGGASAFIEQELVPKLSRLHSDKRVLFAVARLAFDIFLVDKFTRYVDLLPGSADLKLQPDKGWGGDPLDFVLHPTGLQRIKGVYSGEDQVVLDILDSAFRPYDIFTKLERRSQKHLGKALPVNVRLPVASMVTNLKTLVRLSDAMSKVTGGPMAPNLSVWGGPGLSDLYDAERLIAQVFGQMTVDDGSQKWKVGEDIAGAIVTRILYAKALASALESRPPSPGDKVGIAFDPEGKGRPLYDARAVLLGPNMNHVGGHLEALQGGDLSFVISENNFSKQEYDALENLVRTGDQRGATNAKVLNQIGSTFRIAQTIAKGFGLVR